MRFFLHRTNRFEVTLFLVLGYNKCLLLQCPWDMDAPTDNVPFSYEVEYDSVIHAYKSESYAGYQ